MLLVRFGFSQSIVEPNKLSTDPARWCWKTGGINWRFPERNIERYVEVRDYLTSYKSTFHISPPKYRIGGVWGVAPGIYCVTISSPLTEEVYKKAVKVYPYEFNDALPGLEINEVLGGCNGNNDENGQDENFIEFSVDFSDYPIGQIFRVHLFNDYGELVFEESMVSDGGTKKFQSPNLSLGDYHVSVEHNVCNIPIDTIFKIIEGGDSGFEINEKYLIRCSQSALVKPEEKEDILYTLYDVNDVLLATGNEFEITSPGVYSITSQSEIYCPSTKTFEVVSEAWEVPLVEVLGDPCERRLILKSDYSIPDGVNGKIQWYSVLDEDQPIGEGEKVIVTKNGSYFAKIHFTNNPGCDVVSDKIEIALFPPIIDPDFVTSSAGLCNGINSLLLISEEENLPDEAIIRWYKDTYSDNNLLQQGGVQLEVSQPGLYFAEIQINGCHLTMDSIYVRELDEKEILVEEVYDLCDYEGTDLVIDPGSFKEYEWYLDKQLVGTSNAFIPDLPGNYSIWAKDENGCISTRDFLVTEDCEPLISFSTGIKPKDPKFPLVVYYNGFVQEVELYIYDKWGKVVFQSDSSKDGWNDDEGIWDGTTNGIAMPNGNYNLLIKYIGGDGNSGVLRGVVTVID